MSETTHVTSELLWKATLIAALIDAPLLFFLGRKVTSDLFRKLKGHLGAAAFVVYALLWGINGSVYFWDAVYKEIFPAWSRWLLPVGYGLLFGALALLFWWVSSNAKKWQAVWFCLLGGLVSLVGHSIGIRRGLLRVPLLSGASAASALVFGVFEFIFYWCAIVGLGAAGRWLGARLRTRKEIRSG
jgi:hypothetical protein